MDVIGNGDYGEKCTFDQARPRLTCWSAGRIYFSKWSSKQSFMLLDFPSIEFFRGGFFGIMQNAQEQPRGRQNPK